MLKRISAALVAGLIAIPLAVSAAPIRIEFDADPYYVLGDGLGYSSDDTITGWFEFDSDDLVDAYGDGRFLYANGPVDSSFADDVNDHANSMDYIRVQDVDDRGYDYLLVRDGSYSSYSSGWYGHYYSRTQSYVELYLYNYSDWLDTDALLNGESITVNLGSLTNARFSGYDQSYSRYCYRYWSWGCSTSYRYNNRVNAHLTDVHVNKVPEPGTLALLGAGLIGIGIARRRKKA